MKRILVIEDDPAILAGLQASLEREHYAVLTARDGEAGYRLATAEKVELILLDLMLPKLNGEDVCRALRQKGVDTPILMLTSKADEIDKLLGFEAGADDYVTKPFSIRELLARVRALLRRAPVLAHEVDSLDFGEVHIDFKKQEAWKGAAPLRLSAKEFKILQYFAQHEGEVVSRDALLSKVWGYDAFPTTRTVDNYLLSLRKKIETDPAHPQHFLTIHTAGYKFVK